MHHDKGDVGVVHDSAGIDLLRLHTAHSREATQGAHRSAASQCLMLSMRDGGTWGEMTNFIAIAPFFAMGLAVAALDVDLASSLHLELPPLTNDRTE